VNEEAMAHWRAVEPKTNKPYIYLREVPKFRSYFTDNFLTPLKSLTA